MVVVIIAGIGCWPASYVVSAETSSLRLRSKTSGVVWLMGGAVRMGFDLGCPYLYNADAADLGAKIGFIFFATAVLGVVITWFIVPEMKGLKPVEIDRLFERKGSVRRANTSDWERVGGGDEVPLRDVDTGNERTEYDAASLGSSSIQPEIPVGAYEPLRKRPTF